MMTELRRVYDIETLMKWRKEVVFNVFGIEAVDALLDANREYYRRHIPDETHQAFVASIDGEDVGVGAVCLSEELPSPDNPSGKCAYVMNIYVREPYRNHGVAGKIVDRLVNMAKAHGCGKIYLESTDMAKPLYRECGFTDMENMMKYED
ncbi:MAG: GNAT family N-acetyltransferase [Muribaculaceae bacterium]|nr:GNAT family N-acetyltransferase [Muribaculaceae bacterium]